MTFLSVKLGSQPVEFDKGLTYYSMEVCCYYVRMPSPAKHAKNRAEMRCNLRYLTLISARALGSLR